MATVESMADTDETPRDRLIAILQAQPADSTTDDLIRELMVARSVERGMADIDAGRVLGHEEVLMRIDAWRK